LTCGESFAEEDAGTAVELPAYLADVLATATAKRKRQPRKTSTRAKTAKQPAKGKGKTGKGKTTRKAGSKPKTAKRSGKGEREGELSVAVYFGNLSGGGGLAADSHVGRLEVLHEFRGFRRQRPEGVAEPEPLVTVLEQATDDLVGTSVAEVGRGRLNDAFLD